MSFFKKIFGKHKEEQADTKQENDVQQEIEVVQEEEVINEDNEQLITDEEEIAQDEEEAVGEAKASALKTIEEKVEAVIEDETVVEAVEEVIEEAITENLKVLEETKVLSEETTQAEEVIIETVEESAQEVVEETTEEPAKKQGFMKRLFSGLSKTRDNILKGVDDVLSSFKHIDEDLYEELEETLIMADFGVDTTLHIMEALRAKVKTDKLTDPSQLKPALQAIITEILTDQPTASILNPNGPTVILVIGVNGVGKTTSIGKLSHLLKSQNKKVLVAAADTFRAAAIEQLNVWTQRAGVEIIKHEEGSDAAAVVFDAIAAAKSRKSDVLICDTAGRLQNKTNLMKELEKISRIIAREYPEAKQETLIVLDATTGQNAMQQVKLFKEVADISGIILTKLDGTAKGGAIVGIYESLHVPVKYIGVGEQIDDVQPFDANDFAKALFEEEA